MLENDLKGFEPRIVEPKKAPKGTSIKVKPDLQKTIRLIMVQEEVATMGDAIQLIVNHWLKAKGIGLLTDDELAAIREEARAEVAAEMEEV